MKFSVCISTFLFPDFTELNVIMTRHVFGPDVPILISDDRSQNSEQIEAVANKYQVPYVCSSKRRGHFANDMQSWANALAFGASVGSDVSIKLSFRLILLDHKLRDDFTDLFENHVCCIAVPSKIKPNQIRRRESATFTMVPCLSDIVLMKTGCMTAEELIAHYKHKVYNEKSPHASLIESTAYDLVANKFKGQSAMLDYLSFHPPNQPHRYLRKSQNHQIQYVDLARRLGLQGSWNCNEWSHIEKGAYRPRPVLV